MYGGREYRAGGAPFGRQITLSEKGDGVPCWGEKYNLV